MEIWSKDSIAEKRNQKRACLNRSIRLKGGRFLMERQKMGMCKQNYLIMKPNWLKGKKLIHKENTLRKMHWLY